ncbi:MAG: ATP-binding protein [Microbacterium sp.]
MIRISDGEDARFFEEPTPETITLADVGGLDDVKERLRLALLEPMHNPRIAKAYGKSLKGGLLLYGPPGTGKTYLARAIAGELNARFLSVTIADVPDGLMGGSEKNVHRIFERARELSPCVLFIDELDSLGGKRSGYSNMGWMRNVVNQLLQEMDGVATNNEGVFVLAATNYPWDVDLALLRPGRFDRIVLVTPPDAPARAVIVKLALKDRPISMADIRRALAEIKPSTGAWLQSARNVVDFANADGRYDDLQRYVDAEKLRQQSARKPKK